ncbi:MAG: zinc-binding dehydrogenase [Planctomycetes bacterium]|nr:zinc-binding dehydrogenase [Planctomycetota bacterium]
MSIRAAVMQRPGEITVETFPRPATDAHSLLLQICEVGVCGSDRHMYLGHANVRFPLIPGHEMVGTVVERGTAIEDRMAVLGGQVKVGDRVTVVPSSRPCGKCWYCLHVPHKPALCMSRTIYGFRTCTEPPHLFGAFAEFMAVHAHSWVFKIPDSLPPDRVVLIEPAAVATRAVERALGVGIPHIGEGYGIGKRIVVAGAGPIGVLVAAVLRSTGAGLIVVTDAVESRLDLARKMGADETLNITRTSSEERAARIRELTDGVGADVVIECAGVPAAFLESLQLARRGGRVVELGHYTDSGEVPVRPHQVCQKDLDVLGCWSYPPMQFQTAMDFLARTPVPVERMITHRMAIQDLKPAIEMLAQPGVMKVVLTPGR